MSWSVRTKSLLAGGLLLGVGFSLGGVAGVWGASRLLTQFLSVSPDAPGIADYLLDDLEADLVRQLDLTPSERIAVAAEMRATVAQTKRLRAENTLRLRAIFSDSMERMASKMAPEKAARFREMTERRLRRLGLEALLEERKPAAAAPAP
jgi:hypothetical protein